MKCAIVLALFAMVALVTANLISKNVTDQVISEAEKVVEEKIEERAPLSSTVVKTVDALVKTVLEVVNKLAEKLGFTEKIVTDTLTSVAKQVNMTQDQLVNQTPFNVLVLLFQCLNNATSQATNTTADQPAVQEPETTAL